jgi:formate-dependent nitrite reductase membrane component NrfD
MTDVWGTPIAIYSFIAGAAVGSYIIAVLPVLFRVGELRDIAPLALRLSWASIVAITVPLLLHLGSPWRAYKIFTSPSFTSPMTVGAWLITLLIILVTAIMVLDNWYRAIRASTIAILSAVGLVLALIYAGYPGVLLATSKGVEAWWHNLALPVLTILIAVASGLALTLLAYIVLWRVIKMEVSKAVLIYGSKMLLLLLLLIFIFEVADALVRAYEPKPGVAEFNKALMGPLGLSYIGFQLIIGTIIPLILLLLLLSNRMPASTNIMLAISILVLIGAFTHKWNLIVGGELVEMASTNVYILGAPSIDLVEVLASLFSWLFLISLSLAVFSNWKVKVEVSGVEVRA